MIEHTEEILRRLEDKEYGSARRLTGQILHTIHDFYSHSNWLEMGNTDINKAIGTSEFSKIPVVEQAENKTCESNCTLVTLECNIILESFLYLLKSIAKFENARFACPIQYFKCSDNIVVLDRLVSGYYVDQKLPNNMTVQKPNQTMKCSHGGIVDRDSFKPAEGGINKDSGFYFFSPRADLHIAAAKLAIKHTEYYLNQIRAKIGDSEFNRFLRIKMDKKVLIYHDIIPGLCSAATRVLNFKNFFFFLVFLIMSFLRFD